MARIGEGDPRWIVEERSDAANVNNWHWIERDVLPWSKDKLNSLLINQSMSDSKFSWCIKSVSTDGVSTVSMRKGQIKKLFDLELVISFTGTDKTLKCDKPPYEGTITIQEFSWETDETNLELTVNITSNTTNSEFYDYVKKSAKKLLLDALVKYKEGLEKECTHGLMLPTKDSSKSWGSSANANRSVGVQVSTHTIPPYGNNSNNGLSAGAPNTTSGSTNIDPSSFAVNITKSFNCPPKHAYDMFLSAEKMMMVTNSPAYIQPEVGGKFSYIDGTISGIFTKLDDGKYIEMNWRLKSWPDVYYSVAKLQFTSSNNGCTLNITHEKIPAHDLERVDHGWKRMFLTPMQSIFS